MSSFAFGWAVRRRTPAFDEVDLIKIAVKHGMRVIQLGDNLPVHAMDDGRRVRLHRALAAAKIELELGARQLTSAHLHTYLELSRTFGCRLLRFVIDGETHQPTPSEVVSILSDAVPELRAAGITVALENHDRFSSATLRAMVEQIGSGHVGVCLDTANSFGVGEGLAEVTRTLAPVTVNLHLKDVTITRLAHQMGFVIQGCRLGAGVLPLAETIAAVRDAGRCRSAILEAWTPRAATLRDTIRHEAISARRSLAILPQLLDVS